MKNKRSISLSEEKFSKIKTFSKLGRTERRKMERKINKTLGSKAISFKKYSFKKRESLSKEDRRLLMKDKNLLREILKIIKKYIPQMTKLMSELTDKRHKSYIKYNMKSLIMTRLLALICGITSMTEINSSFNKEEAIKNLSIICNQNLKEVPDWQTIQDTIEMLDIQEIENIRKYIVNALIRSKMFDKYKYNGAFQLLVDATGVSSHSYNLNGNCINKTTTNKKGKKTTTYYKQVLEAKIVVGKIVISLDTEWIENTEINNENQKQDCEIKAFKRMAPRIKKNFPKLKFIITGDALYATTPMIDICKDNKWNYIFNLKKDRLKQVYEAFQDNVNYKNETSKTNYKLSTTIQFKGNSFNAFSYQEMQKKKLVTFNYISDLKVNNNNIEFIVAMGRRRWKIENEGFNEQKNGTFRISHLCSRNENALRIHYYFIQIAHIIRQLLEYGSKLLKEMRLQTKKEVSQIILQNLTSPSNSDLNNLEINFQLRFDDLIL